MKEKSKISAFKAVPNGEEKCIWMEAGVIDYKLCNYYYDCAGCPFDKAMKQTADKNAAARLQGLEPTGKKANIISACALTSLNATPVNSTKCWRIAGRYRFQPG